MDLFFDSEFRSLIPPLQTEEKEGLTKSLIAEGNRDPITIWKETQLVLDGHNRYDICTQHGIPLKPPLELSLPDRTSAIVWIITNQFNRRNLSSYSRSVLAIRLEEILKPKAKEKQVEAGRNKLPQNSAKAIDTREAIAKVAHVSHDTVDKVRAIEKKATLEQKAMLVSGEESINSVFKAIKTPHVSKNSGENEWYTNTKIAEAAQKVLGIIDLDPASTPDANAIINATRIFTKEDNGLTQEWHGKVWLNPPYSQPFVADFCSKLVAEFSCNHTTEALVLVNNATETQWFQNLLGKASSVCFPKGRDNFWFPGKVSAPLQGQAVLYFGTHPDLFDSEFSTLGYVLHKRGIL